TRQLQGQRFELCLIEPDPRQRRDMRHRRLVQCHQCAPLIASHMARNRGFCNLPQYRGPGASRGDYLREMLLADPRELRTAVPAGSRLLGLDVGTKTIGLALSDTRLVIASPLETLRRR